VRSLASRSIIRRSADAPKSSPPQDSKVEPQPEAAASADATNDSGSRSSLLIGMFATFGVGGAAAYIWKMWSDQQDLSAKAPVGFAPPTLQDASPAPVSGSLERAAGKPERMEVAPVESSIAAASPTLKEPEVSAPETDTASPADAAPAVVATQEASPADAAAEAAAASRAAMMQESIQAGLKEAAAASTGALQSLEDKRLALEKRREEVKQELCQAVDARSHARMSAALAAAREVCLGGCWEAKLAASLVEPVAVVRGLKQASGEGGVISKASASTLPVTGSNPEEAATAEKAKCSEMGRQALEDRVVELTTALASARLHAKAKFEEALATHLEEAELLSIGNLREALAHMRAEQGSVLDKELQALEISLRLDHEEAIEKVAQEEALQAKKRLDAELKEIADAAQVARVRQLRAQVPEAMALSESLASLEDTLQRNSGFVKQTAHRNRLSTALLRLEDAMLSGRDAGVELKKLRIVASEADKFVADLLAHLPDSAVDACGRGCVTSEQSLKEGFLNQRTELVAATFRPPGGGLLAELVGRFFASLYIMEASAVPSGSSADKVSSTLHALSRAEISMDMNKLAALPEGPCRQQLQKWVDESKGMLQLWQILSLVKARIQCLQVEL